MVGLVLRWCIDMCRQWTNNKGKKKPSAQVNGTGKISVTSSSGKVHVDMIEDVIYEEYSEQPTRGISIEMSDYTTYATIST